MGQYYLMVKKDESTPADLVLRYTDSYSTWGKLEAGSLVLSMRLSFEQLTLIRGQVSDVADINPCVTLGALFI